MAFHPRYFDQPIENSSSSYDYDEWNRTGRQQAAQQITKDTREQPEPERSLELDPRFASSLRSAESYLLGGPTPLDGAEHDRPDALQHRLPHGNIDDLLEALRRRTSTPSAPERRSATSPGQRPRATPGGAIDRYRVVASGAP